MSKLQKLAEAYGYDSGSDLIVAEASPFKASPGVPAICTNPGCGFTAEYEPDSREGWCENCETNTVKSCLVLAGMI